jgi:STE24 endopeptidase
MMSETQSATFSVTLDEERQEQAREYSAISRRITLIDLLIAAAYAIVWVITPLSVLVRDRLLGITSNPWAGIAGFAIAFGLPYMGINLPLSYYSGFVLPHRYGQSTQTLSGWIMDGLKGLAVSAIIGLLMLEVIYWLLRAAPSLWWLYAAGAMLFFTVILSSLAPVLIAPLFYKFTPLDNEELSNRLMALAQKAGTTVKGVYRFDMSTRTKSANAALMGLGATRRIVLGDTLLDEFTAEEIESVLAHELGHQVHRDIPIGIAFNTVFTLLSFWLANAALTWGIGVFGLSGIADPAGLPLFGIVMGLIGLLALPVTNGYSRWRERLADRYALESTRKPGPFADAMTRLANQNLADVDPAPWIVMLLYSHPPIKERVAAARAFEAAN